jgi:hypothetical protein
MFFLLLSTLLAECEAREYFWSRETSLRRSSELALMSIHGQARG